MPWLAERIAEGRSYAWAMSVTAGTVFVACAVVAWLGPERRGVVYGADVSRAPPDR
jgi:hypothetical protein